MPFRPRELVVRAREAAGVLLATIDRNEMIERFLDIYAAENRRPGRADQPVFYREQVQMIRREAILAAVLRIEATLPARLKVSVTIRGANRPQKAKKGKKGKKPARTKSKKRSAGLDLAIPFLDLFREEFFVALGQSLNWSQQDAEEFWRDLELYENLTAREPRRPAGRSPKAIASGPFVDRVALLLDPSLMEQARRAAGKFQPEINAAAERVLRKVFSRRRSN